MAENPAAEHRRVLGAASRAGRLRRSFRKAAHVLACDAHAHGCGRHVRCAQWRLRCSCGVVQGGWQMLGTCSQKTLSTCSLRCQRSLGKSKKTKGEIHVLPTHQCPQSLRAFGHPT
eukprot:364282-Chlamydomonas_euryale.AAC.58